MFVDLGGICLEDSVLIGPRVNLITVNHLTDPKERRGLSVKPIHIKKNAWIGAGATILPGVTIGENAIVAANALLRKMSQTIPSLQESLPKSSNLSNGLFEQ